MRDASLTTTTTTTTTMLFVSFISFPLVFDPEGGKKGKLYCYTKTTPNLSFFVQLLHLRPHLYC